MHAVHHPYDSCARHEVGNSGIEPMRSLCRTTFRDLWLPGGGFYPPCYPVGVSSFVTILLYGKFHRDPLVPQESPAYDGEPWGREFWAEQTSFWSKARATYSPFMVWGVRNWHGKYVNTDDTEMGTWRRTIPGIRATCAKTAILRIWVFGGSTVYG